MGRFINADSYASTGQGLIGHNMFAYCNNNPVNSVDPEGEFPVNIVIGVVFGFVGGLIDHFASGEDFSLNSAISIAVSTATGALAAAVGPAAGALITALGAGINSAISGNDGDEIVADSLIAAGNSLLGSGVQLAVGKAFAGEFIEHASKTQLKVFANSLGYAGKNFKTQSSWTGKIMLDASKKFMDKTVPYIIGQSASFINERILNIFSPC